MIYARPDWNRNENDPHVDASVDKPRDFETLHSQTPGNAPRESYATSAPPRY